MRRLGWEQDAQLQKIENQHVAAILDIVTDCHKWINVCETLWLIGYSLQSQKKLIGLQFYFLLKRFTRHNSYIRWLSKAWQKFT